MKLELKHLAPYLPYGLKTKYILSDVIRLSSGQKDETRDSLLTPDNVKFSLIYCKPILRPLSDLTKEIEFKGEKIQFNYLLKTVSYGYLGLQPPDLKVIENRIRSGNLLFEDANRLFEYHFDVFGLIEEGLAIDINKNLNK
jgi:hypothetical protein